MLKTKAPVSIIVPVYKTKQEYLKKCIESLTSQTFRELEIILVDDGSPDECGHICDKYAAGDRRIKVIHQTNMGPSDARNRGIKEATGNYLMFVDADDWIEKDCIASILPQIERENTDILCFQRFLNGHRITHPFKKGSGKVISPGLKTIQHRILMYEKNYGGFDQCSVWGKLYRKDFITENNITFPEGIIFEDVIFNLYIFEKAESAYYMDYAGYHYLLSKDSITRRFDLHVLSNVIDSILSREEFVKLYHDGDKKYEKSLGIGAVNMLSVIERSCTFNRNFPLKMRETIKITKDYLSNARIRQMISRCRLTDCRSVQAVVRYLLECRMGLLIYYICMKFIRRFLIKY